MKQDQWLDWAIELQSLAQAGLTYGRDVYDLERYQRLRDIAAEMLASQTDLPLEQVKTLFCNETGYQTPKVDTRAAVFRKGRILLVRENDGAWSFPGGWCEVNLSIGENAEKETLEEAGLRIAGTSPDGRLVEMVELPEHPWYVGCQFHPEFKSRPDRPHPLFRGFVAAALAQQ